MNDLWRLLGVMAVATMISFLIIGTIDNHRAIRILQDEVERLRDALEATH